MLEGWRVLAGLYSVINERKRSSGHTNGFFIGVYRDELAAIYPDRHFVDHGDMPLITGVPVAIVEGPNEFRRWEFNTGERHSKKKRTQERYERFNNLFR